MRVAALLVEKVTLGVKRDVYTLSPRRISFVVTIVV
jgi:hypothetical protein